MKKIFTTLGCVLFSALFFSCANLSGSSDNGGVTAGQIIGKIPTSINEFENQSGARAIVNFSELTGFMTTDYRNLDEAGFSYLQIIMTALKNDVSKLPDFALGTVKTVGTISDWSIESKKYYKKMLSGSDEGAEAFNPNMLFTNLGKVQVNYNNNKAEIFWDLEMQNGDGKTGPLKVYIKGDYENSSFKNAVIYIQYKFGEANPTFQEVEAFNREGNQTVQYTITQADDGRYKRSIVEKVNDDFKWYIKGSSDYGNESTAADKEAGKACRILRFKDSTGAGVFMNGNNKVDKELYEIYDDEGSLMAYYRHLTSGTSYENYIPAKYISYKNEVDKRNDGYYDNSTDTKLSTLKMIAFEVGNSNYTDAPLQGGDSSNWRQFLCYEGTATSAENMFEVASGFTFTGLTKAQASYNTLKEMRTQIEEPTFHAGFVDDEDITSMGNTLSEWLQAVSE